MTQDSSNSNRITRRALFSLLTGSSISAAASVVRTSTLDTGFPLPSDSTLFGEALCEHYVGGWDDNIFHLKQVGCLQKFSFVRGTNAQCPRCGLLMFVPSNYWLRVMNQGRPPLLTSSLMEELKHELGL